MFIYFPRTYVREVGQHIFHECTETCANISKLFAIICKSIISPQNKNPRYVLTSCSPFICCCLRTNYYIVSVIFKLQWQVLYEPLKLSSLFTQNVPGLPNFLTNYSEYKSLVGIRTSYPGAAAASFSICVVWPIKTS